MGNVGSGRSDHCYARSLLFPERIFGWESPQPKHAHLSYKNLSIPIIMEMSIISD